MQIQVLFFAVYREKIGKKELELDITEDASVRDISVRIEKDYNLSLKGALCAINEIYVEPETKLQAGDTLAFFPAVSGGAL